MIEATDIVQEGMIQLNPLVLFQDFSLALQDVEARKVIDPTQRGVNSAISKSLIHSFGVGIADPVAQISRRDNFFMVQHSERSKIAISRMRLEFAQCGRLSMDACDSEYSLPETVSLWYEVA